jgi:anti-anti-sigma regulatory factor
MFNYTIDQAYGPEPVTVMRLEGELDASNFESLVSQTQRLHDKGMRNLLLDLSQLTFVSSAGLIGLHRLALIMRGQVLEEAEEGWGAFHAASFDMDKGGEKERHFKLLNPQPLVRKVLDTSGFSNVLPIFDDEEEAIASFK